MELFAEILLELLLEGSFELVTHRKVPVILRLTAGLILGFVYGGLLYLGIQLVINGIESGDVPLILCGGFIAGLMAIFAVFLVRKARNRSE